MSGTTVSSGHGCTYSAGDDCWGQPPVFDRRANSVGTLPHSYRTCLMRAVNSCTRLYTERSSRIRRAIFEVAWMTVVWSRPPNCLPIFGRDESVSSRERYIATWRGYTMFWERLSPQS